MCSSDLRDAGAVPTGVAPGCGERPGPLHPEVEVVLVRVTDRAVALQRGAQGARNSSRSGMKYGEAYQRVFPQVTEAF